MSNGVNDRISRLRSRRSGLDRAAVVTQDAKDFIVNRSRNQEAWESRARDMPYTTFALGAMQEVDPTYTRISLETAERVRNQLEKRLSPNVQFELQGSVPLNVHIRGVSDVDLLVLDTSFFIYDTNGIQSRAGHYTPAAPGRTSVSVLSALRSDVDRALRAAFPAATVDFKSPKAVKIYGASLARPVDVVPSHWYDTAAYQSSGQKHDRAITILDAQKMTTIDNWPFLHIKKITDRCDATYGGLRKSIRLCKNIKAELEAEGTKINLSSFDLASIMYHANTTNLTAGLVYELAILAEAQRYLDHLWMNKDEARRLRVPDGSRAIFDAENKFDGLGAVSKAMDDLLRAVAQEQHYPLRLQPKPGLQESRNAVMRSVIQ
ncbi:hypothetical protein E5170_09250 [Pseudomonas atacamensis]|uniref:cGAS/DncV-like nucleotidyltransferase C-terminal helical domain-containing protein n=1 Tax=Pseudomonas atacamensis TaxID=2565368 RepID=A0AAQ2DFP8_9PSED|nr:hypothetical protein [Pseudomonas atacamensis]THF34441.1 hypothetical protein E5170_09250 [Pseudomonas atacamensis]